MGSDENEARKILEKTNNITLTPPKGDPFTIEAKEDVSLMLSALKPGEEFTQYQKEANEEVVIDEHSGDPLEGLYLDIPLEQLKNNPMLSKFKEVKPGQFEVPEDVQKAYKEKFPNEQVLWVGETNRGTEMNSALVSKLITQEAWQGTTIDPERLSGFGVFYAEDGFPLMLVVQFKGVVSMPDSKNFYFIFENPLTNEIIPLNSNLTDPTFPSRLFTKDLGKDEQLAESGASHYLKYQLSRGLKVSEFIQPGDVALIYLAIGKGDTKKDQYGNSMIQDLDTWRFSGYDDYAKLLDR